MNLATTQLKETYGNLVTTGTTAGSPTTGGLQNGDGQLLTSVGINTNSPAKALHIYDSAVNRTAQLKLSDGSSDTSAYIGSFANTMWLTNGGTYAGSWSLDGSYGIGVIEIASIDGGSLIRLNTASSNTTSTERMKVHSSGDISFRDGSASEAFYWDASTARLGLGTTTPTSALTVHDDGSANSTTLVLANSYDVADVAGDSSALMFQLKRSYASGVNDAGFIKSVKEEAWDATSDRNSALTFGTRAGASEPTERLRIDSSGNIQIQTVGAQLRFQNSAGPAPYIENSGEDASTAPYGQDLLFATGGSESMRITSDGDIEMPLATNAVGRFIDNVGEVGSGNFCLQVANSANDALKPLGFRAEKFVFATGKVGIGETNPDRELDLKNSADNCVMSITSSASHLSGLVLGDTADDDRGGILYNNTSDYLYFLSNAQERLRIDSSGNLMVGTDNLTWQSVAGLRYFNGSSLNVTRDGNEPLNLNRLTSDGAIAIFRKDSTAVGSIGIVSDNIYLDSASTGRLYSAGTARLLWDDIRLYPYADDSYDLGVATYRFDDVYATNGTIQTSDRNEKQDIEELNDAELRVAQQAKTLLRKYRWKSSVEEKGDDARIHFGIIAQDLEQAFTDEGLDAGRYGMFIKSTWTNEDGEEQTRLGVRYNQLLAFIISSI